MSNFVIDDGHNKIAGYSAAETDAAIDAAASNLSNLADAYDATATYAVGDYCIHDNQLYKCTTAITTAEAWNAAHWTATSMAYAIANLNSEVEVQTGSMTVPLGFTLVASEVKRIGHIVLATFVIQSSSEVTQTRTTIGTLATGFRPLTNRYVQIQGSNVNNGFSNRLCTAIITGGGDILACDLLLPQGNNIKEFRGTVAFYAP